MGGKSAKAPDYRAAAEEQAQSSKENTTAQTWANRPTQVTPWGTSSWQAGKAIDPATGLPVTNWTNTTTLYPTLQRAQDAQANLQAGRSEIGSGMLDRIQSEFGPNVDYSKFRGGAQQVRAGSLDGSLGGANDYSSRAGDALQSQFERRMNPQFARDAEAQDVMLRNRGLNPGDAAYDTELEKLRQSQGDQRQAMAERATQLSGAEASRMQGLDANSMQARNSATQGNYGLSKDAEMMAQTLRGTDIAEEMQKRGWSLNEANALISGQQVAMPTMPGFQSAGKAETTQYSNAANQQYQAAQDAAAAKNQMFGDVLGAVTSPFSFGFGG